MNPFHFQNFTIFKNEYSHKIGTDAMVLGASVEVANKSIVLDAGAGSGVLSLMMAQKNENLKIHALEIDELSFEECFYNVENSIYSTQINCIQADLCTYQNDVKYDLIITNPPFYLTTNPSHRKNEIQKHLSEEHLINWFSQIGKLLHPKGDFWLIFPANIADTFERISSDVGFFLKKRINIVNTDKAPIRYISNFSFLQVKNPIISTLVIRSKDGSYSTEYKELTKEFHNRSI